MNISTTSAIEDALAALERERDALKARLSRVEKAIAAMAPLVDPFAAADDEDDDVDDDQDESHDEDDPESLFGPSTRISNSATAPAGEKPGFRSTLIAQMTASVERALTRAQRPLAVAELLEIVQRDGIELADKRKLTDMLYRKSTPNGPFRRVANGLYLLNPDRPFPGLDG